VCVLCSSIVSPGGMTPMFGRTQYRWGRVVLTLYATKSLSLGFCSFKMLVMILFSGAAEAMIKS